MNRNVVGLYPPIVSDLRTAIDELSGNGYDVLVTHIVSPQCTRSFTDASLKQRHTVFSRSDLILEANEWHQNIIAKLTDNIDCDSADDAFRRHSERILVQELSFSEHLCNGSMLIRLHSERTVNLARTIARHIKSMFSLIRMMIGNHVMMLTTFQICCSSKCPWLIRKRSPIRCAAMRHS